MRRKTAAALGRRLCRLEALAASGPRQGAADLEVWLPHNGRDAPPPGRRLFRGGHAALVLYTPGAEPKP